jgi:hypothetical protein
MTGLTNGCDFDHESQPLSSSRGRGSPSDQQETNLSGQEHSRGVRHAVAASLQSALAHQQALQSFQRRANDDYTPANNGAPSSTPETEWPIVSRSSSNNSERRVGKLVKSEAQQNAHDRLSRSPSLNSEHRLSSPRQLSSEGGLSRTLRGARNCLHPKHWRLRFRKSSYFDTPRCAINSDLRAMVLRYPVFRSISSATPRPIMYRRRARSGLRVFHLTGRRRQGNS